MITVILTNCHTDGKFKLLIIGTASPDCLQQSSCKILTKIEMS